MNDSAEQHYRFDCYHLDAVNRILYRDGKVVPLAPKLFDTLHILVSNGGRSVSKNTLMEQLWSDAIVEESNIAQNIFHLRKILDEQKGDRYIETVSKYGYRFSSEIKVITEAEFALEDVPNAAKKTLSIKETNNHKFELSGSKIPYLNYSKKNRGKKYLAFILLTSFFVIFAWRNISPGSRGNITVSSRRSIAVFPFKGLADENDDEQLQLGVTDALINKLSGIRQVSVRPTATILKYAREGFNPVQAGRELNVDVILYGTVQRSDGRIRVTVQLVQVDNADTLWAEKFDTPEKKLFDVQDIISERVSQALVTHLTAEEQTQLNRVSTTNMEAFEAYSKGLYFLDKRKLEQAVGYFQQAIDKDETYALAYNGLSAAYMLMIPVNLGTPAAEEYRRLAKIAAQKALELDESLAEPHTVLGLIIFEESGDWEAAEREYRQAIEMNPNFAFAKYWHAWHLLAGDYPDEALEEMKRARELDPSSISINIALGQFYYFTDRQSLAIEQLKKTFEFDSNNDRVIFYYGLALAQSGSYEEAIADLKRMPDLYTHGGYEGGSAGKAGLGYVFAAAGHNKDARRILNQVEKVNDPTNLLSYEKALIYLELGERKKALSLLQKAVQTNNYVYVIRLKFDPRLASLRQDRNFINELQAVKKAEIKSL